MSNYPNNFDDDKNLYLVQDALWAPLAIDYHPGQSVISAEGNTKRFPSSGIITLVDQCSAPHERAVSFYYGKKDGNDFSNLELISDRDCFKPKKLTKITMQVMSDHREALKNSIINIQKFLGVKHATDDKPKGETVFGRLNFLRKVLYSPKAWFTSNITTGSVPLTVNFKFDGIGNGGPIGFAKYLWKFGEDEIETSEPTIEKTFLEAGSHTVTLTIKNNYGEDTVTFVDMIKAKGAPPEEAIVNFLPQNYQIHSLSKIRTPVNQPVHIEIPKKLTEDKKRTFAGELVDESNKAIDQITNYTWNLGDDLPHSNASKTKALYSNMGGLFDLIVRTDTSLGSYRITVLPDAIDVVEPTNLWIWDLQNKQIQSYEFGLISEVFKKSSNSFDLRINDSFLNNDRQKFEFWRNNGFVYKGERSGFGGDSLLYWSSGRKDDESALNEKVVGCEYNGFSDVYTSKNNLVSRPWNWASLVNKGTVYFILGVTVEGPHPTLSLTNQTKTTYDFISGKTSSEEINYTKYLSGAVELMKNPGVFDASYKEENGHFSAYRTTWKDNCGYLLRNSALGESFNFQYFYKTSGTLGAPFQSLIKLPDLPGSGHIEGDLVTLNHGIYFFDNTGLSYCFNDMTGIWEFVTPHNRVSKNSLDKMFVTSDEASKAYISFDSGDFFRFNEIDMSYSTLNKKPMNKQWLAAIY